MNSPGLEPPEQRMVCPICEVEPLELEMERDKGVCVECQAKAEIFRKANVIPSPRKPIPWKRDFTLFVPKAFRSAS